MTASADKRPLSMHALIEMHQDLCYGMQSPDLMYVGVTVSDFIKSRMSQEEWALHKFQGALMLMLSTLPEYGVVMLNTKQLNDPRYNGTREFDPDDKSVVAVVEARKKAYEDWVAGGCVGPDPLAGLGPGATYGEVSK